jgi:hypothetical protein
LQQPSTLTCLDSSSRSYRFKRFFSSQAGKIDCDQLCTCTTISSSWSPKSKLITSETQKLQLQIVSLALLRASGALSLSFASSLSLACSKSGWTFRHLFRFVKLSPNLDSAWRLDTVTNCRHRGEYWRPTVSYLGKPPN